jgi:hypothetical protein
MLARTLTIAMIALAILSTATAKSAELSNQGSVSSDANSNDSAQSEKQVTPDSAKPKKVPSCMDACKADGLDADECEQECTWIVQNGNSILHYCDNR